jgi:hypothetical protein
MQKNMDDLTPQNTILQAIRNPEVSLYNAEMPLHNVEHSRTPTFVPPIVNSENRDEDSHTGARIKEGNPSNCEEGSGERNVRR